MSKIYFITFAGSIPKQKDLHGAAQRLCLQAKKTNLFDEIKIFTEEDLQKDTNFWLKHQNFIENNKKGFGWWFWKPYIMLKTLNVMKEEDFLVYNDCGCEIIFPEKSNKKNLIDSITNQQIISYPQNIDLHCACYTKQICYQFFNTTENILKKTECYFEANRIFLIKNGFTTNVINEWWDVMDKNHSLFDNSKTPIPELSTHHETRGDQMIYNFILHKYNLLNKERLPNFGSNCQFHAWRNKTGICKLCDALNCTCGCCIQFI